MKYQKEVLLKDGTKCLLRGAGERDAAEILRCFHLTHAETDYLLTYPEENLFTEADEVKFLKASEESANAIEIGAFVDGKVVGSAGIEPLGDKEKLRHRADFGIAVEKAYWGIGIGRALTLACIECAKQAGFSQLELEVVAENAAAVRLYEAAGFRNRKQSGVCSGGKIIQVGQHLFINEQSSERFVRSECESWIAPRQLLRLLYSSGK